MAKALRKKQVIERVPQQTHKKSKFDWYETPNYIFWGSLSVIFDQDLTFSWLQTLLNCSCGSEGTAGTKKEIFSLSHRYLPCTFSPRILILRVFWLLWTQAVSPAVMTLALSIVVYMFGAQRGRGGLMLPLLPLLLAAGESARWVTRAVWQQLGRKGGCTRALKAAVLQWCKQILDERYESPQNYQDSGSNPQERCQTQSWEINYLI